MSHLREPRRSALTVYDIGIPAEFRPTFPKSRKVRKPLQRKLPISMIQELTDAGIVLQDALNRYFRACSAIQGYFVQGSRLDDMLQAFSGRIADELETVTSFEAKIKLSKAVVSSCRNYHTTLVPINVLPPEVLIRIFHFVKDTKDCNRRDKLMFPRCPDSISQVCSNWRQLALRSQTLWTHIDLAPCHSFHQGLLSRAEAYATRAGCLPIHIHVTNLEESRRYNNNQTQEGMGHFLISVAERTRSLELIEDGDPQARSVGDASTLQLCLGSCVAGTLTQLTIRNTFTAVTTFICPEEFLVDTVLGSGDPVFVHQPQSFLENLWRPVTVLRLCGLYPYWTSAAYHGLTELRLIFGDRRGARIPESQLVAILGSSPKLRIFQFDSSTCDSISRDTPVVPVRLEDLEVLDLHSTGDDDPSYLLRWIAPGSRPLQLSFTGTKCMVSCWSDLAQAFFARSDTRKLRLAQGFISCEGIGIVLEQTPKLEVLILEYSSCGQDGATSTVENASSQQSSTTSLHLDRLCVLNCAFYVGALKWLLERNRVHTLTLWEPGFIFDPPAQVQISLRQDVLNEVYVLCREVENSQGSRPRLFEVWD